MLLSIMEEVMFKKIFVTILVMAFYSFLAAGTTGKITGRVTDANTGEPLVGANIIVKGTTMGAATDADGYFLIMNVPPGVYTIQAMYVGYDTKEISGVKVNIDLTATVNITLSETTLETTETITVVARRKAIKNDLTATTAVVGDKEIAALPVTEVSEVLALQAGYVDGHMRGGRAGEVAYWIDGIPVTDSYDGSTVVDVNKDMVQELQVVSGAFNAEYGNAMSGIVNIVTKEGSNQFGGKFNTYIGDYYSTHDHIFWGASRVNPTNIYNFDASLHGAIVKDKVFYFLNARHIYFGGYLYGKRVYKPQNVALFDSTGAFVPFRDPDGKGDGKLVPMNWNRKNYAQAKFVFRLTPTVKFLSNTIFDDVHYQDFDRSYKLNPDGNLQRMRQGVTQMIKMTHTLSPSTFYELGVTGFMKTYEEYAYKDPHDPRYVHPDLGNTLPFSFKTGGVNLHRFKRETKTLLAKWDLTSQVSRKHEIKTGLEFKKHELTFADVTLRPAPGFQAFDKRTDSPYIQTIIPPDSSIYAAHYTRRPTEASFYVQDKMEFQDFIINVGVRFDYFDSDGYVLADPSDPQIYSPIKPENRYHDLNGNGVQDVGEPSVTVAERRTYWYKKAKPKYQFSPRIGAAFPISANGKIYFSYGYFFQRPRFELLYFNPDFDIPVTGTGVVGNADLRPEKTVQGEIGIQQQVAEGVVLDATLYFRDIRDLTGTRSDRITIFGTGNTYDKFANSDFGLIKGLVLALDKRFSGGLSARIDYTYQVAKGTASDPQDGHTAIEAGKLPEIQLLPLAWDQRHTVNVAVNYAAPGWGISMIGKYGSGLPYTPRIEKDISTILTNRATKPTTYNVDLKAQKSFTFNRYSVVAFLRIFNLFDTLNEVGVYSDTGRARETIDELRARQSLGEGGEWVNSLDAWFTNATHYSAPRRIEMGITLNF
ncbi:MAG TPA: TonB-dependent receptor [Caldithrix abyssi]|uniref:TonB-dependent receptor n=1 Tax=Caldithrix abyssi TaxID=187145 RepID=A0A7V5PNB0_CALAY|nr:TonB-dependent receptor [Caldithrix abyssi]